MNDVTPPRPLPEHTETDALARLLPAPAEWDLPDGRHLHHKDILMQQIDHDRAAPAPAAPARRRLLRPAVLAPVAALALAGALTAGLGAGPFGNGGAEQTRADSGTSARHSVALLDRLSAVALATDADPVRDDQFVYVKSIGRSADETSGKAVTGPLEPQEVWLSQVQGRVKRLGTFREGGETLPINAALGETEGTAAGIDRPTYRWLAALPTDPDELLAYLAARTRYEKGEDHDQALFDCIGGLIQGQVMPPSTGAALYRAAARIPGVIEVDEATDALGRHGLGIARDDAHSTERSVWVFDERTLAFLGSRTFFTEDTPMGPTGTLLYSTAVLEQGVVDKEGRRPTPDQVRLVTDDATAAS
ncbi:hypothetical protein E6P78_31250 [Streptomyces sp. A0958]|uniref:CU044_5270 family protein n=1 Tax=Streptomyces sp. A0958 TaxID=2563101 RepID=UPI00109ED4DC|nr:CU044_5270 family protein [Streptomyces sp. A0958]THA57421.1 hypothetical protein E6P78_31250 [Streptomyces sp. A0958]